MASNFYEQVYRIVQRIPAGKVSSYGRIAQMLGRPNAARAVGYALSALRDSHPDDPYTSETVPWQRVINSQGRISTRNRDTTPNHQAALLQAEGVEIDQQQINLEKHLWQGLHLLELDDILK
jgi:methylated-DNA-protein-cysteine methyltransferase-like protein